MMKEIASILTLLLCAGCIMPIPHRRVHAYGVDGRVVDALALNPLTNAVVSTRFMRKQECRTDSNGQFAIRPVYGWHGAYLISPISLSLFPSWDVTFPERDIVITAPGYITESFLVGPGPRVPSVVTTNENLATDAEAVVGDDVLHAGTLRLTAENPKSRKGLPTNGLTVPVPRGGAPSGQP